MNEQTVKAYMTAHGMLPAGETARVLCACSGGADSTALLHLLRGMAGVEVVCAHFNHCLRGAESDRDENFVRELCADWGIEFRAGRGDVAAYAKEHGLGIEAAARELRYRFLQETADNCGCTRIATAHTAGDNAETVLFHLIRGAGTAGLSGIPPVRGNVIRPLLGVTRAEILEYLGAHGLSHVEDSSNADPRYARNALRRNVLPALEQINGAAVEHICAAAELLREDEEYLDGIAKNFINKHYVNLKLPIPPLLNVPKPVAMRVLRRLARNPGHDHLERVYELCRAGRDRAMLDLPGGRVTKEGGFLRFGAQERAEAFFFEKQALRPGETLAFPEAGKRVVCAETNPDEEIHSAFNKFYFQSDKICGMITVGSRAAGDTVRFEGRNCTKSVRKLFAEAGIPPAARPRTLVVSDGAGVIAVEGFPNVAERCAAAPGARALKVEILPL